MSLYSFTIDPGKTETLPNTCAYGYVKNASDTETATFTLYGDGMSTLGKTLKPGQTLQFSNFYIYKILNSGPGVIEIAFSPDQFSLSESAAAVSITGTANISVQGIAQGLTFDITGSTVNIGNTVDIAGVVSITAGTVNIGNTVDISGAVTITSGDVNITGGTVNIGNTVDITGLVSITAGTVNIGNTVDISGAVTITSGDVNITGGTVNIGNTVDITGIVSITAGTVNIGNTVDISGAVTITSGDVNITGGTINIGNTVDITGVVSISAGTITFSNDTINVGTLNTITNGVPLAVTSNTNNGSSATLTTANTAQQFITSTTLCQHFQVRNTSTSDIIYVGNSAQQAIPLMPNGVLLWDANPNEQTDLSTWYFNSATASVEIVFNWQA